MKQSIEVAGKGGRRVMVLGIVTLVLGLLALFAPLVTGTSVAVFVGVLVLVAGAARLVWAFQSESFGKGALRAAIGGLTALCGIYMVAHPLFAVGVLTIVLVAYFIVDGAFEIGAAMQLKPAFGWGWLLFGGIVSVLLGIVMWAEFPLSGAWAIGVLLGIKLLMIGMMMIMFGSSARSLAKEAGHEV